MWKKLLLTSLTGVLLAIAPETLAIDSHHQEISESNTVENPLNCRF